MESEKEKYPKLVTKLVTLCEAWIVGSGAGIGYNPRDYDVFVPIKNWQTASSFIPKDAKINSLGGFKAISDGKEIDIWTGNMEDFLSSNYFSKAYHPKSGVRIGRFD